MKGALPEEFRRRAFFALFYGFAAVQPVVFRGFTIKM